MVFWLINWFFIVVKGVEEVVVCFLDAGIAVGNFAKAASVH